MNQEGVVGDGEVICMMIQCRGVCKKIRQVRDEIKRRDLQRRMVVKDCTRLLTPLDHVVTC